MIYVLETRPKLLLRLVIIRSRNKNLNQGIRERTVLELKKRKNRNGEE